MSSLGRYNKRKLLLKKTSVHVEYVEECVTSQIDTCLLQQTTQIMESYYAFEYDFSVSQDEAKEFLEKFKKDFNQERFDKLIADCKKDVINSIVTPFGLGKIVAAYDKVGGNVDTIHNVRDGVYATEEERQAYENRGAYNSDEYHKDPDFIAINRQYSSERKNGNAIDYMTGDVLNPNESHHLDHIVSAKENHDDAGRVLAELSGSELANTEINLNSTIPGHNTSKKADPMDVFLEKKNQRIQKIDELKSRKDLSVKEQNELRKLEELAKIDDQKALEADKEAREARDKKINEAYYTSKKFVTNVAVEGVSEGSKMGMQQAIGLVMTEFFTALFDEILDIYKNGFSSGFEEEKFLKVLQKRLKRIAKRIEAKWKDVAIAFKDGFLSGFISNLATTAINMFVTTGKRLVRIIREGMFALLKAIKTVIFPPENLSYEEAIHEAKKIFASGIIITLGVIVEQYIDTLIKGTVVLEPFADILTTIFVGAITGLAVTMTVYYLDQKKNEKDAMNELVLQTNTKFDNAEKLLIELNRYGI
jgi:hypothetical protein